MLEVIAKSNLALLLFFGELLLTFVSLRLTFGVTALRHSLTI